MPIAIIIVLVAIIGFYAYKKLRQELTRLEAEDSRRAALAEQKKQEQRQTRSSTLKQDPKTGVYRLDGD